MHVSRRVFLKNGAFALVSLGFAPSFLARTALAAGSGDARQAAHRDLPARRRRRPERRRAVRRSATTTARGRASRSRGRTPATTPPSISTASSASTRGCSRSSRSGTRAQLAIVHACGSPDSTRSHFDAQDYMESGDAGREEHARRLAEPLPAGAARPKPRDAVPRRRADAAAAAHAAGHRAGARR